MNDQEERAFKGAYEFYQKWRETVIETEDQWAELARNVGDYLRSFPECILARNLITAALDTLNEMYRNGMKPMPAGYFGRDDM